MQQRQGQLRPRGELTSNSTGGQDNVLIGVILTLAVAAFAAVIGFDRAVIGAADDKNSDDTVCPGELTDNIKGYRSKSLPRRPAPLHLRSLDEPQSQTFRPHLLDLHHTRHRFSYDELQRPRFRILAAEPRRPLQVFTS